LEDQLPSEVSPPLLLKLYNNSRKQELLIRISFTTQRKIHSFRRHHRLLNQKYRVAELYEYALAPEHIGSPDPSTIHSSITDTGALAAYSGLKTGRTPKEKRVVLDEITKDVSDTFL
jgi:ATP-dependent phosphoenolpyruvate carboxykinase